MKLLLTVEVCIFEGRAEMKGFEIKSLAFGLTGVLCKRYAQDLGNTWT